MKLFLDSCIIIYWHEMAEPYYSSFIQTLEKLNRTFHSATVCTSRLSTLECCVKPLREKDQKKLRLYYDFFNKPELEIVEIDAKIIDIATQLRAHFGLKTPDAIQAASALSLKTGTRFITNDSTFRKIPELDVISI